MTIDLHTETECWRYHHEYGKLIEDQKERLKHYVPGTPEYEECKGLLGRLQKHRAQHQKDFLAGRPHGTPDSD